MEIEIRAEDGLDDLVFKLATRADLGIVSEIYTGAAAWLHDVKGITRQWPREIPEEEVRHILSSNRPYLAYLQGEPAGVFQLAEDPVEPWEDRQDAALYVHSFAVRRQFAGQGVGKRMLAWAEEMARQQGKQYLRLDCMYENPGLKQYYANAGFESLGRHPRHTWYALFQRKIE